MRTSVSIDIAAPCPVVFALARAVERWPALLPHYDHARLVGRGADGSAVVVFVARRELVPLVGLGMPLAWRSRVRADPKACTIHFRHLGGATGGMTVTWRLEENERGCRVTIEHDFGEAASRAGLLRALAIDRLFVRPVATRTLSSFRAIAEAAVAATAVLDEDPVVPRSEAAT